MPRIESDAEPNEPWTTVGTTQPVVTPWFSVQQDRVITHTGNEITFTYLAHRGAVYVVPVTPRGEIVLMRQYRYPVRDWCWEVPAGGIEEGEDTARAAERELEEELGGACESMRFVAAFYESNGISGGRSHIYLATGVELRESKREETELLHVVPLPLDDALLMAHAGEVTDGQSALALLLCEPYLRALK